MPVQHLIVPLEIIVGGCLATNSKELARCAIARSRRALG